MCNKWVAIFKVKVTETEFGFIQWNHDYFYMFWTADFLATNLVCQCNVHKLECLAKRLLCCGQGHSEDSELQCPDNISDWSNLVWWCIIISQSIIQKYCFAMFTVKATIISTRSSEMLTLLQSKLVWWYIITRQDFLAFTQVVRQRIDSLGDWTR